MASAASRTYLAFQHNAKLHTLKTVVTAVRPFAELEEANRQLYKDGGEHDHVVVTEQTIFHPQGGGQPSDVGAMTTPAGGSSFAVASARMDAVRDARCCTLAASATAPRPSARATRSSRPSTGIRRCSTRACTRRHVLVPPLIRMYSTFVRFLH
ncbi:uncharacterized protein GLRG_06004 [Colletotrichum graminicola M1.001]|uniref:Alanyl-tRNA synthetase n=1 Tax=Colletotrichum graminicola (strain M1.001 / M2 / FGSC 10212) TaxID=645133 RepID=E3QJ22_COLGM|nr:uncharacterized protein GLRG_06004 [Colletotrichum graminicola M1.001]EFQ30860.1 hypothetical protein GLRG_06004 [Colletotrichum graminicola M1.001]